MNNNAISTIINLPISNRFEGISTSDLSKDEKNAVIKLALNVLKKKFRRGKLFTDHLIAKEYLQLRYGELEREVFTLLLLDNRHRLIRIEDMFFGTIDGASVHIREIMKTVLKHNAASVILHHNHPSGATEFSRADKQITSEIKTALRIIDVRVIDHILVSFEGSSSMTEMGLL